MTVPATSKRDHQRGAFLRVIHNRLKERGWVWFVSGLFRRVCQELLWFLTLPASLLGHLLGYRCLYAQTWHVGHLAADIDTFLKEERLGLLPKRKRFVLGGRGLVANRHLLEYWRQELRVIMDPLAVFWLELMSKRWLMREDLSRYISNYFGTQDIYRVNRQWGNRKPLLELNAADEVWAKQELEKLGISEDRWFVCVHVREGSYIPKNEVIQAHRSSNISNAIPAMEEIVRRGGICVRMGDPGMTALPPISGVIDYAHHSAKSERLDVVLCAKARFFLGDTSGLSFVSTIFGVPVAQANMIPAETQGLRWYDLSMPKLLRDESLGRNLTFNEVFSSPAGGYFFTHQYTQAGLRVEENSPEDILNLVCEMLDRLGEKFVETEEDGQLHEAYQGLFKPGHYSYGSEARVCLGFLRRHRDLLENTEKLKVGEITC